jgi:hypothetical protein
MYADTGKLINTHPEKVGKNLLEWFQKNSALGSKGINLIDYLGVNSVDWAIKKYSDLLLVTEQRKRKSR